MVSNWQARFQGIFCPGKLPYFERATKILTCLRSRKTENPLKPSDFGKEKRQQTFYQNLLPYLAEDMGLEPTRPFSPTRFPGELLSHSVNRPRVAS